MKYFAIFNPAGPCEPYHLHMSLQAATIWFTYFYMRQSPDLGGVVSLTRYLSRLAKPLDKQDRWLRGQQLAKPAGPCQASYSTWRAL